MANARNGVVIAGGGLAGQRCAETLRRVGYGGAIRILAAEPFAPYDRPPLSKEFLKGNVEQASVAFRPPGWYRDQQVELLLGRRAVGLDAARRRLHVDDGGELAYDDLLIATGSRARRLADADGFENVHQLRDVADACRLRPALRPGAHLVVIGAGFIGQEVAATARSLGAEVTIVEAAAAPLGAVLGNDLGGWFGQLHRDEGVRVLCSTTVSVFHGRDAVEEVELADGRRLPCDAVVVGIGVVPATEWLQGSGIPVGGIPVATGGRTALPHVYAAGDAAMPFDEHAGGRVRSEHWEGAARAGTDAARAMLGLEPGRRMLSSFWSDQYGLRIQYLGHAREGDAVEIDGAPAERDFTALYRRAGRPVAALLVGRPHALPAVRRLIDAGAQIFSGTEYLKETA
jgi:NADPH-dependent 2,4-dienoyl-CoA reductase/sulfur reductase-like enzyme